MYCSLAASSFNQSEMSATVDSEFPVDHNYHMKRTTLMVDPSLLSAASRALGSHSYSDTVNQALAEAVRAAKIRGLFDVIGTGAWSGDLAQMREDRVPARRTKRKQ